MSLPPDIDTASTRSFDVPATAWTTASRAAFALRNYEPNPWHDRRQNATSGTWTTSSGELADFSDTDDAEIRDGFAREYNRVAKKVGLVVVMALADKPC